MQGLLKLQGAPAAVDDIQWQSSSLPAGSQQIHDGQRGIHRTVGGSGKHGISQPAAPLDPDRSGDPAEAI